MTRTQGPESRRGAPTGWLAVCALALLAVLANSTEGGPKNAAAPSPTGGIVNPADDRLRMVAELEKVNHTLEAIQAALERGGIKVEVVKLPAAAAAKQ